MITIPVEAFAFLCMTCGALVVFIAAIIILMLAGRIK